METRIFTLAGYEYTAYTTIGRGLRKKILFALQVLFNAAVPESERSGSVEVPVEIGTNEDGSPNTRMVSQADYAFSKWRLENGEHPEVELAVMTTLLTPAEGAPPVATVYDIAEDEEVGEVMGFFFTEFYKQIIRKLEQETPLELTEEPPASATKGKKTKTATVAA